MLQHGDEELAERFSSPKYRNGGFDGREWTILATRAPALVGCLASFDCVVNRAIAAETHTVFFGGVAEVRLWSGSADPLLYWNGSYRIRAALGTTKSLGHEAPPRSP